MVNYLMYGIRTKDRLAVTAVVWWWRT